MKEPAAAENKLPIEETPKIQPEKMAESSFEVEEIPEVKEERIEETVIVEAQEKSGKVVIPPSIQESVTAAASRDPLFIEVERELEDGLWDVYRELSPTLRSRFRAEGERIARLVRNGIASGQLTAKKLIEMIINWLRMIPHVNKWFLRQEAKIKADALMQLNLRYRDKKMD
jgi:hypothetical protein